MAAPAAITGGPTPLSAAQPAVTAQPASAAQPVVTAQPVAAAQPVAQASPPVQQNQPEQPAGNIYAAPAPQRRSDIEELLSLSVPGPTYTEPTPTASKIEFKYSSLRRTGQFSLILKDIFRSATNFPFQARTHSTSS